MLCLQRTRISLTILQHMYIGSLLHVIQKEFLETLHIFNPFIRILKKHLQEVFYWEKAIKDIWRCV